MKKILLASAAFLAFSTSVQAQVGTRVTTSCASISWTWGADDLGRQFAIDTKGRLCTSSTLSNTGSDGIADTIGQLVDGGGTGRITGMAPYSFNGTTWDRNFTCPLSAVVNVTAGATTEIVALTASQVIRVCSFAVSMSAAGTAQFVYGTGTNCGTGTTSITGAIPLATGTPLELSAGLGSLFRTASANALCVAAVTGNVVGFVSYVKY